MPRNELAKDVLRQVEDQTKRLHKCIDTQNRKRNLSWKEALNSFQVMADRVLTTTNIVLPDPREMAAHTNNKESLKLQLLKLNAQPRDRKGLLNALATARNRAIPLMGRRQPKRMYKKKRSKQFNAGISRCYEEINDFVEEEEGAED